MNAEVTMQFEYDPERLIEEIKKRPGIWDYEHINYRTMSARIEMWNEVVSELLQPNVKVSKAETRELVLQLQKKWKSIKDAFNKYVQNPNRSKRPYIYHRHLQFLLKDDNTIHSRKSAANAAAEGSDDSDDAPVAKKKKSWKPKSKNQLQLIKTETSEEEDNFAEVSYDINESDNAPAQTITSVSKYNTTDEFAFANVDSRSVDSDDCDKMFLLSLLPHLKSVPEESRLIAKMELMRVLRNANDGNLITSTHC